MSELKAIAGTDVADAEVELSAEDLLGLCDPCESNKPVAKATATAATPPGASTSQRRDKSAGAAGQKSLIRVALSVTAAVAVAGASYLLIPSRDDAGQSLTQEPALQPQMLASASVAKTEGKPVLFANPFDKNEVFEFPAGTSEAQARDAVAELLMERAMERQRKFDARVSSNR